MQRYKYSNKMILVLWFVGIVVLVMFFFFVHSVIILFTIYESKHFFLFAFIPLWCFYIF